MNDRKVAHLLKIWDKMQHDVMCVLTVTSLVHGNGQLLTRVALPQPELIKQVLYDEGCNIFASLLRGELALGV
jgi:hypothetical protein